MAHDPILLLLLGRSESALEAMAERFGPRLLALCMNILGSREDAEETVSDTYLAVWNSVPPRKPDPLDPFVYRTGRNLALKRLRWNTAEKRSAYEVPLAELEGCIGSDTLSELTEARELGRAIDRFLSTLSRENRVMFLRRYWYGDSVADIAAGLGLRKNTVTVRLGRIRERLRTYLQKEGYL